MEKLLILRFPFESRFGGEERHTMQLAEGLRARGHEVFFAGSDSVLLAEMRSKGFATQKIWGPKPPVTKKTVVAFFFLLFFFWVRVMPVLFSYRIRGVKTAYCLSIPDKFLTLWMRLLGMHVVWVEHARIGRWLTRNPFLPLYWMLAWLTKGVVFTSRLALKKAPWIPHAVVIPCGIAVDEFKNVPKMEIAGKHPVVGVVARFSKDKGVDVFLQASAVVRKRFPDTIFVCCGDGPEEKNLRALVRKLDLEKHVIFLKTMDRQKLGALYKRLHVIVLPSTEFDPFGLVPAEAMAVGVPAIVTNTCGIAGYVQSDVHAVVIPPNAIDALAQGIIFLLENPLKTRKIAHTGKTLIHSVLSEEKMITRFCNLFF